MGVAQGTSQNCSGCGAKVPKTLKDRLYACPECGLTIDLDKCPDFCDSLFVI
ncbi:MAG: zinc ribbon domain-containing protein [Leptodesmis sp.]|uniref:zinc ribbon domain-containing protein n=1 Tax=Leptodesmis sp. TaxID=3100501 RepID=UPI003D0F9E27